MNVKDIFVPVSPSGTGNTFNASISGNLACQSEDVCDIAKVLSKGLLMGARGNDYFLGSHSNDSVTLADKTAGKGRDRIDGNIDTAILRIFRD